jgi:hypothetical protein
MAITIQNRKANANTEGYLIWWGWATWNYEWPKMTELNSKFMRAGTALYTGIPYYREPRALLVTTGALKNTWKNWFSSYAKWL